MERGQCVLVCSCNILCSPAQGWADLANHVLRCHLPLIVPPEEGGACGVVVEGVVTQHRLGELIVFDDSKKHYAFNSHPTDSRVVLIFDLARPDVMPLGSAKGATTKELMSFIDYFK